MAKLVSFRENLSEWSAPVAALAAVAIFGLTAGNYSASSENAALKRDLDFVTEGRGMAEAMQTLEKLSDSANNVFRFERHALELAELSTQIETLKSELQVTQDTLTQTKLDLRASNESLAAARAQVLQLEKDLQLRFSTNEEFSLKAQTSKSFFDATQTVGVDSVFGNFVSVITPSGQNNLSTGEVMAWRTDHTTCRLTLTSIESSTNQATFTLVCI